MRRSVSCVMLILLLICTFTLAFNVGRVHAQVAETIYINSDGSVSPSSAPISSVDNVTYTFTGNISYPTYSGIIVERSNIVIDGNGYALQGNYSVSLYAGLSLEGTINVTLKNTNIEDFQNGIYLLNSINNVISGNNVTANSQAGVLLDYSSNNTISGNNATTNWLGILVDWYSSNNIVSGNDVTADNNTGIWLADFSDNNNVSGNNATANPFSIVLSDSSNNIVSSNNVTANGFDGVDLMASSNNIVSGNDVTANNNTGIWLGDSSSNTVSGNNATANAVGIYLEDSSSNAIFHDNFVGNSVQASVDSASIGNTWDNGYPSGGNYWSDYNGTDLYSGPYQNVTGSDGIGDTPYVINANNTDHYPLMKPYAGLHDVGIAALNVSRTVVGQGLEENVTVTASDLGTYPETFTVAVYFNTTIVASQNVTLSGGVSTTLALACNTTGLAYGNYTLSAYAWPVPGETNTFYNNCTDGNVVVTIPGDVLDKGRVDMTDVMLVANAFGSYPGHPRWNPACDLNGDGKVDLADLVIVLMNFGKHYP